MEATIIVQPASFFHQVVQSRRRYCFHQFQVGRMLLHGNSLGGDIARVRAVKYLRQKRTVQAAAVLETPSWSHNCLWWYSYGAATCQGTGRPDMEETYSAILSPRDSQPSFFGVFDGHGGIAVAEMLKTSLWPIYKENLSGSDLVTATISSYLAADQLALAQPKGFLGGLRERGLGGSRCGATAATAVLLPTKDGKRYLISANVGDARVVLSRDKCAIQLTVDHKPEVEAERKRIEAKNPTPKKPLVVNVGGTWRVGGLLALSRAFGDAYLKE
ncbi:hypothetical protein O6H91_10G077500 [Diphasiastrum complanatum]|uniref:Uncharacterized protein n=1 Tax=Diphasiastrum complanatum TaxID=34168 RepID=A0ACC2CIH8_DIPCM|nr:hypothetical protein O6H91_10G077500 [Diphasiastrum complanatum]